MKTKIIKTKHFDNRLNQRGIKNEEYETLIQYADLETNVGNGVISYSLSSSLYKDLREFVCPHVLDRIKNKAILIGEDGVALSILNISKSHTRHYRGV